MAWTARSDDEKKEFFDSPEELDRKVSLLAQWMRESKHSIAFTGAGVSTSTGIPDFRSGMNTTLTTGPGAWELRAKGQLRDSKHKVTSTTKAIPSATHMTFVKLQQEGLLKCVISQNCDGLHRRSGLPKNALFELHGNSNVEKCTKCKREYLRDYRVRRAPGVHDHATGKRCDDPSCDGYLEDTIINFGESLPTDTLETSFDHSEKADLCLAMGSSLTVTPAANIPETVGQRQQSRLVIVNLQRTPLDSLTSLRIFAKTDDVSRLLMSKLGLEIPEFRLKRKVIVSVECGTHNPDKSKVLIQGADLEGLPFSFLRETRPQTSFQPPQVHVLLWGKMHPLIKEPYVCVVEWKGREEVVMGVQVLFHSHYGEPPIAQQFTVTKGKDTHVVLSLEYNPFTGQWDVSRSDEEDQGTEDLTGKMQATKV